MQVVWLSQLQDQYPVHVDCPSQEQPLQECLEHSELQSLWHTEHKLLLGQCGEHVVC